MTIYVTVLNASFTGIDVFDDRDVLSLVGGVKLLGEYPGRNVCTKCSRRYALCCNIYNATRKMEAADANMLTYVVYFVGIGRLTKFSPEDLNAVAMNQRIRNLEKRCITPH